MSRFGFEEMQEIQKELREHYRDIWGGLSPQKGRDNMLWAIIEAGETADIIKKDGDDAIMNDEAIRRHFIEEFCDTMMYLNDMLLCYSITPEEVEQIYLEKHRRNMSRWDNV